jgi:squalene-hopene/tetraprenyl-beta-curcumene cyclase
MRRLRFLLSILLILGGVQVVWADAPDPNQLADATVDKALAFLKSKQKPDFGWQDEADPPGVTALVLRAFLSDPQYDAGQPFLQSGFGKLLSYQVGSGGIYKDTLACYNTAISISALADANKPDYRGAMLKALDYLRTLQWSDQIAGVPQQLRVQSEKDVRYGGFGYGRGSRPDLSNTQMALDALHDAGVKSDDPAFAAALKFVSRCQNFSETNDQPFAGDDGGFIYTPANGGNSPAGEYLIGGRRMLRSYGSMTYAGLKSMIYAGLSHDDPRVKAAWDWISKNFTVDENPGMEALGPDNAQGGLYYYFYTMARALDAYGEPVIIDDHGVRHDWRLALIQKLPTLQRPDGSFIGQRKWMEDNPVLVTAYTVMVLEQAKSDWDSKQSK